MERRTFADLALHPDPATMLFDDPPEDVQAQAHAVETPIVDIRCARKTLEDARKICCRDANPRVLDGDARVTVLLPDFDPDGRALRTVLLRVLDQVLEQLLDAATVIHADHRCVGLDGTGLVSAVMRADLLRKCCEVHRLAFANEPTLLEARPVGKAAG